MGKWDTKYEDNPAMIEGAIPDIGILNKERKDLITSVISTGIEVVELDFPAELDQHEPKHDFVFIRDPLYLIKMVLQLF